MKDHPLSIDPSGTGTELPFMEAKRLVVEAFERDYLGRVMRITKDSVAAAARLAGIDRTNFRRMLQARGIQTPEMQHVPCDCRACAGHATELRALRQTLKGANREIRWLTKQIQASERARLEFALAVED